MHYISIGANLVITWEWNMGVCLQMEKCDIKANMAWKQKGYLNPTTREAQAILNAIMVARMIQLRKISILTGCVMTVKKAKEKKDGDTHLDKTHLRY